MKTEYKHERLDLDKIEKAYDERMEQHMPNKAQHSSDCNVSLGFAKGEICNCHMEAMQQAVKESAKLSPARHSPHVLRLVSRDELVDGIRQNPEGAADNFIRAVNNADKLAEELAVAKSQIENHDVTLKQIRLIERSKARKLTEACQYAFNEACRDNTNQDLIDTLDKALSDWNGAQ